MKNLVLQKINFSEGAVDDGTLDMFYRGDSVLSKDYNSRKYEFPDDSFHEFFTYFNAFFIRNWVKYTNIENLYLEINGSGKYVIELFGHYIDETHNYRKEWLGKTSVETYSFKQESIRLPIPVNIKSDVISFQIHAKKNCKVDSIAYITEIDENKIKYSNIRFRDTGDKENLNYKWNQEVVKRFTSEHTELEGQSTSYTLSIGNSSRIIENNLHKLYAFTSLLRDEYRDSTIGIIPIKADLNKGVVTFLNNVPGEYDLCYWGNLVNHNAFDISSIRTGDFETFATPTNEGEISDLINVQNGKLICVDFLSVWSDTQENQTGDSEDGNKLLLHRIVFDNGAVSDGTQDMYYRGDSQIIANPDGKYYFADGSFHEFFTYFNSLSIGKWRKYTFAEKFSLVLDAEGAFSVQLFGHYMDKTKKVQKEWLGNYDFNLPGRKKIELTFPEGINSIVVAFQLKAVQGCRIFSGGYYAYVKPENLRDPFITLATTTFKKETYVKRNIALLCNTLFADKELAAHFTWKIIDNGATLDPTEFKSEYIEVVPSTNVGGSGGFAKGMIEALHQKRKPSHIVLMDDDVVFIPDSFYRLYRLLSILKPEYDNYFISGAMLEINYRNIQHEDIGIFRLNGEHGPVKPSYDLNIWDNVLRNEILLEDAGSDHYYSGWWYCCIPTTVAREDNLPLPFFIRGDDVEYSLRNHAKFISMNGICIWHEGFGIKFSSSMEFYQVHRNDLILQTMTGHIKDVEVVKRIQTLFWEQLYRFNYKGCNLLLESIEDFLKGPKYLEELNGEACMLEKKAEDNQMVPMTDKVRNLINHETLYINEPLTGLKLKLYGYFINGQKLPEFLAGKKETVIPYGWGYSQKKLYRAKTVYAVDPVNDIYATFKRDKKQYKELITKYKCLMQRLNVEYESVAEAYREDEKLMHSIGFWNEYLEASRQNK